MTTARSLADEGTEAVLAADVSATRGYADLLEEAIEEISNGPDFRFTAEDVRELVVRYYPDAQPHHPNLLGAKFRELANAGRIVPVGWTEATRPESRGRALRVWQAVTP